MLEVTTLVISSAANGLLGLFVLLKNQHSATSRAFFMMTCALVLWSVASFFSIHPVLLDQLTWARVVLFCATFLCYSVYLTFSVFPRHRYRGRWLWPALITILTLAVMVLTLSPWVFSDLVYGPNGSVAPAVEWGMAAFLFQALGTLFIAVGIISRRYLHTTGREKQQIKYLLAGLSGMFGLILITNMGLVLLFHTTVLVAYASAFTLIFTFATGYAIVRHRLLNIRSIVARSVAYIALLVLLAALYAAAIFGFSATLARDAGVMAQHVVYIGSAILLVVTFTPLKRLMEKITDRVFYRERYNSQAVLGSIGKILTSELLLDRLLDRSLKNLCGSLNIGTGQIVVIKDKKIYKLTHLGPLPERIVTTKQLSKLLHGMIVSDELEGGERKEVMEEHGIRVSMVLHTREGLRGFLLLGDKLSGDIYSSQDLGLLEILARDLSVSIENAMAYEEIAEFNKTLQYKVEHATAKLRDANRNLKAMDAAKDEFISMASHQLRTPLTTIKGYLSMVLEGDAGPITIRQQEFLGYTYDGAQRMVSLISDLLNVSRMSAGKFLIEQQPVDFAAVVADEASQLRSHAEMKGLKLLYVGPSQKLPTVMLDEGKTRQVIMNFIDNAIYYTKEGNVTVALEGIPNGVKVTVTDTGIGVPEKAKAKLFTKFFRAENAQMARPDGTGLGLYLAKRVVEDQGGTILFESSEGKGSTFGFTLPLALKATAKKPPPKLLVKA